MPLPSPLQASAQPAGFAVPSAHMSPGFPPPQHQQHQQQHDEDSPETPTGNAASPPQDPARRPGKRPAARGTAFYPRKRANTACQVCRARKTKCDNKKPSCSYCLSVGANCIQSPVDLSSFDPASLKILDRLDDLERLMRETTAVSALGQVGAVSPAIPNSNGQMNAYNTNQHNGRQSSASLSAHSPLRARSMSSSSHHQKPHAISSIIHEDDGPDVDSVLPVRVDFILQWPVFNARGQAETPYRQLPDAISTPSAGSAALASLVDMESHRLYRLLDNFFLYIHCKNPILDEASTRRMVGNAFLNGIDWSPASCLAMIICALGCLATPFGPSHSTKPGTQAYQDSQVFFHAAQKRIGILLVSSDIVGAQCLFLSGVYMMHVFQPIYAWRFFSQALAACQHFPFLAKVQDMNLSKGPDLTPEGIEMGRQETQEQAVYWSAWKSERELRRELSLPDFDIIHSGSTLYPPFFPAPPAHPTDSADGPDSETQRARAAWLYYLAEISLRRLSSRLSTEVTSLRKQHQSNARFLEVLGEMIPEYEAQAREWSDNLPAELSINTPIEEDTISRSVLRGQLVNLYEMLYWPFVMASLSSLTTGRPVTMTTAQLARRGLETHIQQVKVNEPGYYHRHHGGLFMIRACTRSALILVAAAKLGSPMPDNWHVSIYNVMGMLSFWNDEDRNLVQWGAVLQSELSRITGE
ncbi:hypothetical protein VHEMI01686 [[Torrubiella] hemipterigena]|uniref:Zn(2)-C6 fungal-type domain-containing protein n=1 Tax=[Torrubiella] hemipterigena TaxID=1531966 RepID=A0A0A1T620_9HYPO|nr:hypothetical protein VHEMI01686 [[Torrubiella] hemipterigena]